MAAPTVFESFLARLAENEGWMILGGALFFIFLGLFAGWVFWNRMKTYARMIESETCQIQSEYDLVSRDMTKLKQDIKARNF